MHADVPHLEAEALDQGLERFLQTKPAVVGADGDGLFGRRERAELVVGQFHDADPREAATSWA